MNIIVKVIYEEKYKSPENFDEAIERWIEKGWKLADVVNDIGANTNAAILWDYNKLNGV